MEENLTNIKIPNFVLTDWFKHQLVEIVQPSEIIESSTNNTFINFLGSNKQKIALIVHDEDGVHISDKNLTLIEKLLLACKLTLEDVAIVNLAKKTVLYKELKQQLTPSKMILFGVNPTTIQLPLIFPMHKIQAYDNCQMLITSSLNRMQEVNNIEVTTEKKELWALLKKLFGV